MIKNQDMKKLSMLMLAICSTAVFGQKVSDYKYVSVPDRFTTFKGDYGLEDVLTKALKSKKYIVLATSKDQWPWEAKDHSCNVLNANVISVKSFFTNKLVLEFKDCNNKTVLESKGSSDIKEFEEGLADALNVALKNVGVSNPTNTPSIAPETTVAASTAANYSNGKIDVQKIQIDQNQFILAKSGSSVPFAIFKTTSKKDVFIVKLSENTNTVTIGYIEGGNIVIDVPQADGNYTKEVFNQK